MSDELDKEKHSVRLLQKQNHIKKQIKIAKSRGFNVSEPHRYAKTSAMTCGDSNCVMCGNPRKFWKELTVQERRFYQDIDVE